MNKSIPSPDAISIFTELFKAVKAISNPSSNVRFSLQRASNAPNAYGEPEPVDVKGSSVMLPDAS